MDTVGILKNQIQEYAWGSRTAIASIMGNTIPSKAPQAELWMGAHPKAPSKVYWGNQWYSLLQLIEKFPQKILGRRTASRFENKLPFLFKILAADQPLSIQAHPNLAQAQAGFLHENKMQIPLDAFHRNYKDDNHKPEIICALTPFWALNGFRSVQGVLKVLECISSPNLQFIQKNLTNQPSSNGIKKSFVELLNMSVDHVQQAVLEVVTFAYTHEDENPLFPWLVTFNELYPGDIGILCAILLNLVSLRPGEAMFLPAGQLHAYLDGVGIELMANSDNVLRGGLTSKHIDNRELLKVLSFSETKIQKLRSSKSSLAERVFLTQAEEFILSKIIVNKKTSYTSHDDRSVEVMICVRGKAKLANLGDGNTTELSKGVSVLIPASVKSYQIEGSATFYKASVP